jgi:hypothetical protein
MGSVEGRLVRLEGGSGRHRGRWMYPEETLNDELVLLLETWDILLYTHLQSL